MEQKAKEFAHKKHTGQMYGTNIYDVHFLEVASLLKHYGASPYAVVAGILHDTMEDTDTTYEEIKELFCVEVADMVSLLTDKKGKNRTERHLNTYYLIRTCPEATLVKMCDRMANMKQSLRTKDKMKSRMYIKEYMQFKFALYSKIESHEHIWADLDAVFEELKKIV